jgi:hypothetical protein
MASTDKINVETYIDQFNIVGKYNDLNYDVLSQLLYSAILNKFKVTMNEEEYVYFKEYQERVFDLVENLRELSTATISIVFNYLDKINNYLPDIIIMLWCLPRTDTLLSKRIYNNSYKQNIIKYNEKIIKNINHTVIKNFCIETLTKTNNVPIHCIDYIWYYMNTISMEFTFYNSESNAYIGFIMPEHNKGDDNYIDFGFNMEYLLEMDLGKIIYENDPGSKGSFRNFLKKIVVDAEIVKKMLTIKTKHNYQRQMLNISKNPSKYFGDLLVSFPEEVIGLINKNNSTEK